MTPEDKKKMQSIYPLALSRMQTVDFSFEIAEKCIKGGIEGDFVECGVFAGAQCAAMAHACKKHKDFRNIHLFDTFEGIPQAGEHDDKSLSGKSVCSMDKCFHYLTETWGFEAERFVFHPGLFADTVPNAMQFIQKIAILRLDGDLYESTKDAMQLYPKLVKGGFLIIDDYALTGCRRAINEYFGPGAILPLVKEIEGGAGPVYIRKP